MKKVGIICDLGFTRHTQYTNYFYGVFNLWQNAKIIRTLTDLDGLDILFIGDDHCYKHKAILQMDGLVETWGNKPIVVLTSEKILNSFPQNIENNDYLKNFSNLYHYTCDVDDCEEFGTKVHRICMSVFYKERFTTTEKQNRIIFIGSAIEYYYSERVAFLDEAGKVLPIDVIINPINDNGVNVSPLTWNDYIWKLASYRFVLCPLGIGNYPTLRFYETLTVGSIPLQQIKHNTLKIYDKEAGFDDCIFFKDITELKDKVNSCTIMHSHNEIWFEDELKRLLIEDGLF